LYASVSASLAACSYCKGALTVVKTPDTNNMGKHEFVVRLANSNSHNNNNDNSNSNGSNGNGSGSQSVSSHSSNSSNQDGDEIEDVEEHDLDLDGVSKGITENRGRSSYGYRQNNNKHNTNGVGGKDGVIREDYSYDGDHYSNEV
jgi:hypothetical protein